MRDQCCGSRRRAHDRAGDVADAGEAHACRVRGRSRRRRPRRRAWRAAPSCMRSQDRRPARRAACARNTPTAARAPRPRPRPWPSPSTTRIASGRSPLRRPPRRRRTPSRRDSARDTPPTSSAAPSARLRASPDVGEHAPCLRPGASRCRTRRPARAIAPRPVPGRAGRRVAVAQARARRSRCRARGRARAARRRARRPLGGRAAAISPPPRVLDEVGRRLGDDERDPRRRRSRRSRASRASAVARAGAPRRRWLASLDRDDAGASAHFHRVIATRVPSPGLRVDLELVRQPLARRRGRGRGRCRWCSRPAAPARCRRCRGPGPRTSAAGRAGAVVQRLEPHRAAAAVDRACCAPARSPR